MKATIYRCEWLKDTVMARIGEEEIENIEELKLEELQEIVGGLIDIFHWDGCDYIVNDEGILLNLPVNPYMRKLGLGLCGTVIKVEGVMK